MGSPKSRMFTSPGIRALMFLICAALTIGAAAAPARSEDRGVFNEDITLGDYFTSQSLNQYMWQTTGNATVEPEDDASGYKVVTKTSSVNGAEDNSFIASQCKYDLTGKSEVNEIDVSITRHQGTDNPIMIASLDDITGAGGGLYVMFLPGGDTDDPAKGFLALRRIDGTQVTEIDTYSTCSGFDPETGNYTADSCSVDYIFLPIARIPYDVKQEFRIQINQATKSVNIYQNGERMMSFSEMMVKLGKLLGDIPESTPDYPPVMTDYPIDYRFILGFGQTILANSSVTTTRTGWVDFHDIHTTFTRACNQQQPTHITDATPARTDSVEYQKVVGSSVGVDSGNLTVSLSPPSMKYLGQSYAPTLTYYSGDVAVKQLIDVDVSGASPNVDPDTNTVEIKFNGSTKTYVYPGAAGEESRVAVMEGAEQGDNPLKTGVYFYTVRASQDYEDDSLRLASAYGSVVPVFDLDSSPYGKGWYPSDIERLVTPNESIIVAAGAGGDVRAYMRQGNIWFATGQQFIQTPTGATDTYHFAALNDTTVIVTSPVSGSVHSCGYSDDRKVLNSCSRIGAVSTPGQPSVAGEDILIPDRKANKIYTSTGASIQEYSPSWFSALLERSLSAPVAVAAKSHDDFYVANYGSNNIIHADKAAKSAAIFAADVFEPRAMALDTASSTLYVLHSDRAGSFAVSAFDTTLKYPNTDRRTVITLSFAVNPTSMYIGPDRTLYVVDSAPAGGKIYRIYPDLGFYYDFTRKLKLPMGVAVTSDGYVFTAQVTPQAITVISPEKVFRNGPGDYSYIQKKTDGTFTRHLKHGDEYNYDADGLLVSKADRNNNSFEYSYDPQQRLTMITGPSGDEWDFGYDSDSGLLSSIRGQNRTTAFTMSDGALTGVEFPDSLTMAFGYDSAGFLYTKTDVRGQTYAYSYDYLDRIQSVNPPGPGEYGFSPAQTKGLVNSSSASAGAADSTFTDLSGNVYSYDIDRYGQLGAESGPLDTGTVVRRDEDLNPTAIKTDDGVTTGYTYDGHGNMLTRSNPLGGAFTYEYDNPFDFPTKMTDPLGRTTTYVYDQRGNLQRITDALGRSVENTYDSHGLISTSTDKRGNTAGFVYNPNGNILRVTAPCGDSINTSRTCDTSYDYDSWGNVVHVTNPRGYYITNTYDSMNRLLASRDPLDRETTYVYDRNLLLSKTLPGHRATTYEYDDSAQVVSSTDPEGRATTYEYDVSGYLSKKSSCCGQFVSYPRDTLGRVTRETYNIGFTDYAYNQYGRLISATDALGRPTTYNYDAAGNVTSLTPPGMSPSSYEYDLLGNLTNQTDPKGNSWSYIYDPVYQLKHETDPINETTSYAYDPNGNTVSVTDPLGHTRSYSYTQDNRLESASDPLGNKAKYRYSETGRVEKSIDPLERVTSYDYDELDRASSVTTPESKSVRYSYYPDTGFLESVSDTAGRSSSFKYNKDGQMIERRRPGYASETFSYTDAGALESFTKKDGARFDIPRDDMLRSLGVDAPGSDSDITFTRDTLGRVTSVSDSDSDSAFAYDASTGFVTSSSYQALKGMAYPLAIDYSFQYDGNGNIMNSTVRQQNASGGLAMSEQFAYDPLDRVTSASVIPESGASFAYDAAGRPVSITRLNGVSTSFSYDPADRLSAISESHPQLPNEKYVKRNIARNPLGFISSVSDSLDGDTAFSYDTMNRLTAAARADALSIILPDESYSYSSDGLGHRTASVTGGSTDPQTGAPVQVDYTVDTQTDQLREDSLYTYTYDANGNRTERESKSDGGKVKYQYDVFDRLVSVKKYTASDANNPESEVNYKYDWSGRLIEKEFRGHDPNLPCNSGSCPLNSYPKGITRYEYNGLNLIAELDGENKLLASYQHAPGTIDMPISMRIGDNIYYYHYDELGSVVKITNSGGQIVQTYRYDSFGRIVLKEGDMHNPFTYTGRLWDDDAELYHYRARVYDPETGEFLQQDPVFSMNPYAYTGNNPVNYTDPLGLCVNDGKGGRYTYDAYVAGKQLCNSETCWIGCPMSWEQYRDRCHAEGGSFGASPGVIYAIWVPPYRCVKCTPISIPMDCEKSCQNSSNAAKCSSDCYKALGKVLDSPTATNDQNPQSGVLGGDAVNEPDASVDYYDIPDKSKEIDKTIRINVKEAKTWYHYKKIKKGITFTRHVIPHGEQDYKNKHILPHVFIYYDQVITDPDWLGNYNYGAAGHAAGYALLELLDAADVVSVLTTLHSDSYKDKSQITQGYMDYVLYE
jgi:RHS repeat-associated protein